MQPRALPVLAAVTLGGLALIAPAAPATAGAKGANGATLMAMWHLDEAPGSTVMVDSSGHDNDGVINSHVTLGMPGDPAVSSASTAYQFNSKNPLVSVPDGTGSLNPGAAPITVTAYLKVPAGLQPGDYNIIQKGKATEPGGAWKMEEYATTRGSMWFGYPHCAFNTPADSTTGAAAHKDQVYGPKAINDGLWHKVECHLTSSSAYTVVDGVSGPVIARTTGAISNTSPTTLGGKPNGTHFFSGIADEVSVVIG
jgi:Concanavalin A-like lectin/glucanases superfamily